MDARQRFLAPGGRLIPQEDTLWAAVVELPEVYEKLYLRLEVKMFMGWICGPHGLWQLIDVTRPT